ncbi:hypothetical protein CARUB_v10022992mg [Capsella rubella]|uniref:Glutamyl-tRNA reductase n=1 Tax=Capsella rubella TaxID=81985 RepID=R0HS98_9BRAS|nr:probable glutamyl-tRNA reductase 3, chloroplastic [Capsella rubella]EOA26903.1 hypothetical protein CARUB_v10022992mg [Capsella rubella]
MAVSSSAAFVVIIPKVKKTSSWNHHSPYLFPIPTLPMNNRTRRGLIHRSRCELSPSPNDSSALNQLKNLSLIDRYTRERSSIVVIGLSIHTAPLEMREKLAIPEAEWPLAITQLCALNHIEEAAVLSTCNRIEIYVSVLSLHRGVKEVTEWMSKRSGIPVSDICHHRFLLYNKDATLHLFQVSAGLDSLVLGEGQILAQVKQVSRVGKEKVGNNGFGMMIGGLFEKAISAGALVRQKTNIASGAVSVSSAAVELALTKVPGVLSVLMLVIGAGKMGRLVIKHLVAKGCTKMVVVNRSEEKVEAIRKEMPPSVEIIYKPFDEMLACAAEADVIFTSTASETPLFLKDHVEMLPPPPADHARLFVDISVPRNVGSCVAELDGARVYNVDDLKEVVDANKEYRARKAMEARDIITQESKMFEAWRDSLQTVPTIKKLRSKADRIRAASVEKFMSKHGNDIDKKTREAVEKLTGEIVNKILHGPMQHLRCDGSDSRMLHETLENMEALNRMYELDGELLEEKIRTKKKQK